MQPQEIPTSLARSIWDGTRLCFLLVMVSGCSSPAPARSATVAAYVQVTDPARTTDQRLSTSERQGSGTLSTTFANDLFAHSDGNFSNGVALLWTSNDVGALARGGFCADYVDFWSFLPVVGDDDVRNYVTFGAGQTMSTPTDISVADPPLTEQPYAGLLAASTAVHARTDSSMHSWWLMAGIVGPSSRAEQTQKAIHKATGSQPPMGWEHQLSDEPVVNVYYDWKHRLAATRNSDEWGADLISSTGGGLGNAWIGAWGSVFGRWGYNLPDNFGPSMPRTGLGGSPIAVDPRVDPWQVYLFLGADVQLVGRTIFLDGNNWTDSRSVDSEPWVAGLSSGFGLQKGAFALTFSGFRLTNTYTTQVENNTFGAFTLTLRL